ncbi:hypothetical protein [Pseudonocardia sp.]|uniref:hypothetical protein n=1 Tax=Pseudonocardia sp. TaxID=60912 RepID=UPI003D105156
MSTRSWDAWRCGELLGAATGTEVRLTWSGRPGTGAWSGWVVQWHDGPTEAQMRATAAELLAVGVGPPADELSYGRCLTAEGEAVALLLWLAAHPRALRSVGAVHLVAARDEVPYPERADDDTRARAVELLARGGGRLGYEVLRELARHARCGWAEVTAWLDGPVAPVVDLGAERARRRGTSRRRRRF